MTHKAASKVHDRTVFSVNGTGKPDILYGTESDKPIGAGDPVRRHRPVLIGPELRKAPGHPACGAE